jgi:hypothetical protein
MKVKIIPIKSAVVSTVLFAALAAVVPKSQAMDSLTNGVVAYWPMDSFSCTVPDLGPNGFDLKAYSGKAVVPFNGANILLSVGGGPHANVNGHQNGTNAIVTQISQATVIGYIAPVTNATQLPNLSLPPLNLPNWTISFWLKAVQGGGNTGNRMFAIAEVPLGNGPNLLWDLTQNNQGDPNQFGHFRRQNSSIINGLTFLDDNFQGDQLDTTNQHIFDGNWHHVAMVAQTVTNSLPVQIDNSQFINPNINGYATIAWTNNYPLDVISNNAAAQVDTNQFYGVYRSTDLQGPWTLIQNAGNGGTYNDTGVTTNPYAFYQVSKPLIREQTRYLYVDGQLAGWNSAGNDSVEYYLGNGAFQSKPAKTGARFRTNGWFFCDSMMFGGFVRAAGEGGFVNASYSDAGVWNRALSPAEINAFMNDGITNSGVFQPALFSLISAEYPAAAQGDTDKLTWSASKPPADLVLTPGFGDVTAASCGGNGSTNAIISSNTTFTLTTVLGLNNTSGSASVICVSNVAPNWHFIDSFTYLSDGPIVGQGGWLNPPRGPATQTGAQPFEVHTANDGNNVASFDGFFVDPNNVATTGNGGVAGRALGSFASKVGNTNTLFFRFYIDPSATNFDPQFGPLGIAYTIDIQDLGVGDPAFNYGGPGLTITESPDSATTNGPINLTCSSGNTTGITVSPAGYSYVSDPNTGNSNGLAVGKVYSVWIDVVNNFPGVVGGFASGNEQTNACLYSVWLQREDWAARTNLFASITCTNTGGGLMNNTVYPTGYLLSGRNYAVNSQENILLGPSATLNYVQLDMLQATTPQATNGVRFDDFYISKSGVNSTVPVAAGSFVTP